MPAEPVNRPYRGGVQARAAVRILVPLGGVLVVASAFLPWVDRGLGSSLALYDLGDLLLGGDVAAVVPRWAGVLPYLIPGSGALLILLAGIDGSPWAQRGRSVVTVLLVALVLSATVLPLLRHVRPSGGQLVAGIGAVLVVAGALSTLRPSERHTGERDSV